MYKFALLSNKDRDFVFNAVATKKGLTKAIVEKDFWVCLMLDYLFNKSAYKDLLTFKGGTSLSKGFNLINRFSEDIDLILNWECLGVSKDEPLLDRSNTKQDLFNKELNERAGVFIKEKLLTELKTGLSNLLKTNVNIQIDEKDNQVINFYYPKLYSSNSILQFIRLEIGPLSALSPAEMVEITPYASEVMEIAFKQKSTKVLTVSPKRTFWEKATILHREANRPKEKSMPLRYSRHYYDLYMMGHSIYKNEALKDYDLLNKVVKFKKKFYRDNWANYDQTLVGEFKLVPPSYRLAELEKDYKKMQEMLYGNIPTLNEILDYLKDLEKEINSKYK
jgi:hypothetical protein